MTVTCGSGYDSFKRVVDVILASTVLVLGAPVIFALGVAVRLRLGGPVLFAQVRPGRHGHPFRLYKFRTMTEQRDEEGELLPDALRLTEFGRWLRTTSLDELPEFWNVLRGDMSLVGPRPLLMDYLPRFTPEQARRHEVRPGITGWAQINGRNELPWDRRLALDVWYVDHRSLWLDVRILLRTIVQVLTRRGISTRGHATSPRYDDPGADDSGA